jgi:7-cyano-7-deazaguanine synthase
MEDRPAIVLCSGGLDSTTCLAIARAEGYAPLYSLCFDYGQRHRVELEAARRIAEAFAVAEHRVIRIDLAQFGGSALTGPIPVPKDRDPAAMGGEIPITYVPARNTIFLAYALAWAEVLGVMDVFIGVNAIDYSGYPDCRPEFVAAFERLANLATRMTVGQGGGGSDEATERRSDEAEEGNEEAPSPKSERMTNGEARMATGNWQPATGKSCPIENRKSKIQTPFRIHTPLIHLSKAQIIRRGIELGVDYSLTHSCYDPAPDGAACGRCDSCLLRRRGFAEAGVADPTRYAPA